MAEALDATHRISLGVQDGKEVYVAVFPDNAVVIEYYVGDDMVGAKAVDISLADEDAVIIDD